MWCRGGEAERRRGGETDWRLDEVAERQSGGETNWQRDGVAEQAGKGPVFSPSREFF